MWLEKVKNKQRISNSNVQQHFENVELTLVSCLIKHLAWIINLKMNVSLSKP